MASDFKTIIKFGSRIFLGVTLVFLVVLLINQLPRIFPGEPGMASLKSEHFLIWYIEDDKRPAIELKTLLEDKGLNARKLLGLDTNGGSSTEVYLYPDRISFDRRRWGEIGRFLAANDAIIATKRGTLFMIISPRVLQGLYDHQSSLEAGLHAYIRGLMDEKNIPMWLQEGLAYVLGDGSRDDESDPDPPGPDLLFTDDPVTFSKSNAPEYIDSFLAWLCTGPEGTKIISKLVATDGDPFAALGLNRDEAWLEWTTWLREGRPRDPRLYDL